MQIRFVHRTVTLDPGLEIVERKGHGHPDTLCDALAEELSRAYSAFTREQCGAILHHNFDKVGLLGGRSHVAFGCGRLTRPIRVLLNGRATETFAGRDLQVRAFLERTVQGFFVDRFPRIEPTTDLEIHFNLSTGSSPGQVATGASRNGDRRHWFDPRGLHDLRELERLHANDTSAGCGYYPLTHAEECVLAIEQRLNSRSYKVARPWLGSDIKIMAVRVHDDLDITLCIPQIANHVPSCSAYRENLEACAHDVMTWAAEICPDYATRVHANTSDDYETCELYLTALGSAIESGDEGLVGRGNRPNGLIAMCRPYTMEGACGKNPVYHVGKVYSIAAQRLAERLHAISGARVEVFAISQRARDLCDPWQVVVTHDGDQFPESDAVVAARDVFGDMTCITEDLVSGRLQLF